MGDELDLLQKLAWKPEKCLQVDCYWAARGDVVFLEVMTKSAVGGEEGLYARLAHRAPPWVYVTAVVDCPYITRAVVEGVMVQASKFRVHRMRPRAFGKTYRQLSKNALGKARP